MHMCVYLCLTMYVHLHLHMCMCMCMLTQVSVCKSSINSKSTLSQIWLSIKMHCIIFTMEYRLVGFFANIGLSIFTHFNAWFCAIMWADQSSMLWILKGGHEINSYSDKSVAFWLVTISDIYCGITMVSILYSYKFLWSKVFTILANFCDSSLFRDFYKYQTPYLT